MENKVCPHCGESLSSKAISCKACGSDSQTGFSDAYYSEDLEMDYEEILENEFGSSKKKSKAVQIFTAFIVFIIVTVFFLSAF